MMRETFRGVVYPWQCDIFEHLNVQFYMEKFDQAAWGFFGQMGLDKNYFLNENRGIVAMEQKIRYFKELLAGDLIYVQTELTKVGNKSLCFRHLLYHAMTNEIAAEMNVVAVQINTLSRKSEPFSVEIKALLQTELEEGN